MIVCAWHYPSFLIIMCVHIINPLSIHITHISGYITFITYIVTVYGLVAMMNIMQGYIRLGMICYL